MPEGGGFAVPFAAVQIKREPETRTGGVKKSRSVKERETEDGCYGNRNMAALQKP